MKLPVHILDQDDTVPLPGGIFLLDLPTDQENKLKLVDVQTSNHTIEKRALFLIPKKQFSFQDIPSSILEAVHSIGSVGVFQEREPADTFILLSFNLLLLHCFIMLCIMINRYDAYSDSDLRGGIQSTAGKGSSAEDIHFCFDSQGGKLGPCRGKACG